VHAASGLPGVQRRRLHEEVSSLAGMSMERRGLSVKAGVKYQPDRKPQKTSMKIRKCAMKA